MMRDGRLVPIPPKPNDPVECERNLQRINNTPLPAGILSSPGWLNAGGGSGFSVNGGGEPWRPYTRLFL
jgi:hypothetical protein